MNINNEIEKYVTDEILPRYSCFDKAHNICHVTRVIQESLLLVSHFSVNPDMVYTIAAYHDLGLIAGREEHHKISGSILRADCKLQRWFIPEDITVMAEAVEDHRASASCEPRSIYGKIVAEADRDIEPLIVLRRAVQYGLSKYSVLTKEAQFARFRAHIDEKYGKEGYIKLWIPFSRNAEGLSRLRAMLLDENLLHGVFDEIYNEEIQRISGR
ncbi:MAG: HD domain-containing protein [Bacteroidales bacterium]